MDTHAMQEGSFMVVMTQKKAVQQPVQQVQQPVQQVQQPVQQAV